MQLIYERSESRGDKVSSDIESWYKEYGKKVYLFALALCSDPDNAEEIVQETFFQAVRSTGRYEGKCTVYTWLCSIARNVWLCELRRRKYHPVAEPDENVCDTSPGPDEVAEIKDENERLRRRINRLPENERELFLLRAAGELSFREIGEIYGKTENWARVTYYRLRQKLGTEE